MGRRWTSAPIHGRWDARSVRSTPSFKALALVAASRSFLSEFTSPDTEIRDAHTVGATTTLICPLLTYVATTII